MCRAGDWHQWIEIIFPSPATPMALDRAPCVWMLSGFGLLWALCFPLWRGARLCEVHPFVFFGEWTDGMNMFTYGWTDVRRRFDAYVYGCACLVGVKTNVPQGHKTYSSDTTQARNVTRFDLTPRIIQWIELKEEKEKTFGLSSLYQNGDLCNRPTSQATIRVFGL